ncbi:MAG: SDR family NAD(P)-dependent oxidoreductase [Gammaproteobacteria bacterium]
MSHAALTAGASAVVTGAADGIGLAAAERFRALGMDVLMADVAGEKLAAAAAELAAQPGAGRVESQQLDVGQFASVDALRRHAYASFGRVDVLMNNAGTSRATTATGALEDWRHLIDVNLWGVIHGVQAFVPAMIAQGGPGLVINTGSKQGITNPPGNPAYNVSKAGVRALTEALAHELRETPGCELSAHLLVPGFTWTGLVRRHVAERPAGAWLPAQVIDYLLDALARGSFYVICPDNEVSSEEDRRRILWAAGDLAHDRPALSRWHPDHADAFAAFRPEA